MPDALPIYTVYARPKDYPDEYVVRIHRVKHVGFRRRYERKALPMSTDQGSEMTFTRVEPDPEELLHAKYVCGPYAVVACAMLLGQIRVQVWRYRPGASYPDILRYQF